jgi:hypothetical protein
MAQLILKGRQRFRQLSGEDLTTITLPLTNDQIEKAIQENINWQIALSHYLSYINNNFPKNNWLKILKHMSVIIDSIIQEEPIKGGLTFYTDANKLGYIRYTNGIIHKVQQSPYKSVQNAELAAIILLLQDISTALNIVTDSQYCCYPLKHIVAVYIPHNNSNDLFFLFHQLQDILLSCNTPILLLIQELVYNFLAR